MSKKFNSTEFDQLLQDLYELERFGIKVGLEHTQNLLETCGNPQENFKSIHIAGTNGKGSTAAMVSSILVKSGYSVGLYTSPHLIRFNERIRVNGVPISDERIVEFMSHYKTAIDKIQSTFFEATTVMAFDHFSNENVDVAVVETGLGGRLDSTNVLKPMITIISSITVDHTEILGTDLKTIAFEKGGIIKKSVPLVLSSQMKEVRDVLFDIAGRRTAEVHYCEQKDINNIRINESGTSFRWQERDYKTNLIGEHQAHNSVLAIEATRLFNNKVNFVGIIQGLEKVHWPGRIQKIHKELPVFYDVAHNSHGIQVVFESLATIYNKKPVGLLVLKAEKNITQIARVLKSGFKELVVTGKPNSGLAQGQILYRSLVKLGVQVKLEADIKKAIAIVNSVVSESQPGLIFGSHYIADTVFNEYGFPFDNGVI